MYLQAKLNLTERMVAEASLSKNLKEGGPSVNVFLGPDMFFAPSEGPGVAGSCGKTTGGACTEEEMKAITEGLRRISERHPEVTLMPGTIVWSKPVDPVPVIDGLPRPTDMAYNTGPVFSSGSLTHMTYKMTDGGDANTTAVGINGPTGSAATAPSLENRFGARLQVFPKDAQTMDKLTKDGKAKVEPILDTMARQAAPLSGDRDWEVPLRGVDAGPRSPYNTIFTVGDKVMALEICRDHSNGQAEKEYRLVATAKDPVSVLAKARGGADLHVLLAAASTISPNSTVCRTGGVMTYNDIGKGRVHSYFVKERVKEHDIKVDRTKKLEVTYQQYDAHKKGQSSGGPAVGLSSTDMKGGEPVRLAPVVAIGSGTGGGLPVLERPPGPELGLGLGLPIVDRAPSVREAMRGGAAPGTESRVGLGQTGTEATAVSTGPLTVRSEAGLDKPKATVGTGTPTVSVGTGI
jgi:hypothetical protein